VHAYMRHRQWPTESSTSHRLTAIYALNAATGAELWTFPLGMQPCPFAISPVVASGVVYVTSSDETVHALSAQDCQKLCSHASGSLLQSAPDVANGTLYIGTGQGGQYAFGLG
jgi:eukaryotic-like serine/threonine-protein kinase